MSGHRSVTVGEDRVELHRFSAYKMLEVTEVLARIGDSVPEVLDHLAEFIGSYEVKHGPRMQRATAEFTYGDSALKVSEKAWESAGDYLQMAAEPSKEERVAAIFPLAFRKAREHTTSLLAIVACTNREFEDADERGENIYADGGLVDQRRRKILHRGTTAQMVELLSAAIDVCRDELKTVDGDKVGKIMDLLGWTRGDAASAQGSSGSKNAAPPSSSASPRPSRAGRARKSSTGSPGASSAPSPAS